MEDSYINHIAPKNWFLYECRGMIARNVLGEVYELGELSKHDEFVEHFVGQTIELRKKRELETLQHELNRLIEIQWTYAKRMLKFGVAAWVFGLSLFFFSYHHLRCHAAE